jgi:5-methylcytosine-specific restriction endonuclease McrA
VAHALPDLPKISEKLRLGEISYSKVRAMTRVATAENEEFMLMIARHGTAAHVERVVRNFRKVKRIEALELDNERHYQRKLDWFYDDDGYLVLKGRFTPEAGAVVVKALQLAKDHLFVESKDVSAETPEHKDAYPFEYQNADAMLRVAEGFLAGAGHDTSIEDDDDEEIPIPVTCCDRHNAQWRAEVAESEESEEIDESAVNGEEIANHDAAPTTGTIKSIRKSTGGDRYLVHIHTDINTLKADGDGAQSGIDDRANVSAETSRRLACDASVVHWLENHKGEPLSIGRKSRSIPPSIRRALQRRDHGCRFPGCTCVHYVDAHHIKHWADGGETSMENLALLCRKHHRFVHEEGFGVHPKADGRIYFTDSKGKLIPVNADGLFRGNVESLTDENSENGVEITAETGKCWWGGEGMDDNHAMTCMLQLE